MWKYLNPFSILIQQATAVKISQAIAISFQSLFLIQSVFNQFSNQFPTNIGDNLIWQNWKNSIFELFDKFCDVELNCERDTVRAIIQKITQLTIDPEFQILKFRGITCWIKHATCWKFQLLKLMNHHFFAWWTSSDEVWKSHLLVFLKLLTLWQISQNLEEIVLRLTKALGLCGNDKVFICDKWLERGKKVRRYHRTLFFNLFSRGQTAPHGYKQIGILWNIKYTHAPQIRQPLVEAFSSFCMQNSYLCMLWAFTYWT